MPDEGWPLVERSRNNGLGNRAAGDADGVILSILVILAGHLRQANLHWSLPERPAEAHRDAGR